MDADLAGARDIARRAKIVMPYIAVVAIAIGFVAWVWIGDRPRFIKLPSVDPTTESEFWVSANLPHDARIAADHGVTFALTRAGFSADHIARYDQIAPDVDGSPAKGGWRDFDYLVSTEVSRLDSLVMLQVQQALVSSVPVAVFGTGPHRVEVRQILPGGTAGLDARRAVDAKARQQAETGLLGNPRLHPNAVARRVLATGGLDLRAATVLALIAEQVPVQLAAITTDPAEVAAGLPARTVEITLSVPSVVADAVRALPADYLPVNLRVLSRNRCQLVWPVGVAPVLPAT
jgi:hypothetical protein